MTEIPMRGYGCPDGELPTRLISGKIECIDDPSFPLSGTPVVLLDPTNTLYRIVTTTSTGLFAFTDVPDLYGYTVTYNPNDVINKRPVGYTNFQVQTAGPVNNVVFQVEGIGDLTLVGDTCVTLLCESGAPMANFTVNLLNGATVVGTQNTDINGTAEFLQVPVGFGYTYQIITDTGLYIIPDTGWDNLTRVSSSFGISNTVKAELIATYFETVNAPLSRARVIQTAPTGTSDVYKIRNAAGEIVSAVVTKRSTGEGEFGHVPAETGMTIEGPGLPLTPYNAQAYARTEVIV